MNKANPNHYYDLDQIKQIPILEVCSTFGIEVKEKSGKHWCKVRPERTESVILHTDRNIYHDFGTTQTSDNIGLVSAFFNVDRAKAIRMLGEAFHILPVNPREGLQTGDLSVWDYEVIGLDGKMATRNFDFDPTRQDPSWIMQTSLRYAIPMNILKKTNRGIYEKLLWNRAIPHVRELRQDYYLEVLSQYQLAKAIGSQDVFEKIVDNGDFDKMIKDLQTAERVLERACRGTKIEARPVGEYDPKKDIDKILSGEAKLTLGNTSKSEMYKLAKQGDTSVKYQSADLVKFMADSMELDAFRHSAYLKDGKIIVAYLESDREEIKPLLDQMRLSKDNLNDKISDAQQRQGAPEQSISGKEENLANINTSRKER